MTTTHREVLVNVVPTTEAVSPDTARGRSLAAATCAPHSVPLCD